MSRNPFASGGGFQNQKSNYGGGGPSVNKNPFAANSSGPQSNNFQTNQSSGQFGGVNRNSNSKFNNNQQNNDRSGSRHYKPNSNPPAVAESSGVKANINPFALNSAMNSTVSATQQTQFGQQQQSGFNSKVNVNPFNQQQQQQVPMQSNAFGSGQQMSLNSPFLANQQQQQSISRNASGGGGGYQGKNFQPNYNENRFSGGGGGGFGNKQQFNQQHQQSSQQGVAAVNINPFNKSSSFNHQQQSTMQTQLQQSHFQGGGENSFGVNNNTNSFANKSNQHFSSQQQHSQQQSHNFQQRQHQHQQQLQQHHKPVITQSDLSAINSLSASSTANQNVEIDLSFCMPTTTTANVTDSTALMSNDHMSGGDKSQSSMFNTVTGTGAALASDAKTAVMNDSKPISSSSHGGSGGEDGLMTLWKETMVECPFTTIGAGGVNDESFQSSDDSNPYKHMLKNDISNSRSGNVFGKGKGENKCEFVMVTGRVPLHPPQQ